MQGNALELPGDGALAGRADRGKQAIQFASARPFYQPFGLIAVWVKDFNQCGVHGELAENGNGRSLQRLRKRVNARSRSRKLGLAKEAYRVITFASAPDLDAGGA